MVEKIHNLLKQPILYLRNKLSDKHFFIFASILVGLSSGLAAIVLKYFVHSIEWMVTFTSGNYEEFFIFACFPLIGILLTVCYVKFFLKNPLKRGSAEIGYAIIKKSSVLPPEDMYAHLITSGLTVGFGGSLGLESPMVTTGAAIGSNFAQTYGLSYRDRTILLACGASAGIAAAFNAPIAGVLFAIEVLLADVSASAFIPLIISAASGALLSAIILKEGITLTFSLQQPFNYHNVPFYIILGILAGFVSLFYAGIFGRIEKRISVIKNPWIKVAGGGLILLVLILLFPPLFGEGYETIKLLAEMNSGPLIDTSLLRGWMTSETHLLIFLGALIFLKAFAAAVTVGSGGNGGSFAPSLFVGAYLGFVFARLVNIFGLAVVPESNFTIVAMAGILSGVFYAPLTAIFLIAELTGGYDLMIPLMIVASLSIVVTRLFEPLSPEAKKLSEKLNVTLENRDKLLLSRLELSSLIETNFCPVRPEENLKALVKVIASSNRNIFPVVNNQQNLEGLIYLDKVRQVIFDVEQYEKITARELMVVPFAVVDINENLHEALVKFDSTNQWNLPVVDQGQYIGFLSKSTILTRYRNELLESA
jgi:CIC family chloride channel protein